MSCFIAQSEFCTQCSETVYASAVRPESVGNSALQRDACGLCTSVLGVPSGQKKAREARAEPVYLQHKEGRMASDR